MILIKSKNELEKMRIAGYKTAKLMGEIEKMIRPGVSELDLETHAESFMKREGVKPAFKGYMGYPSCLCISVNEEVVHGIPKERILEEGDIVGVDMGVIYEGYYGDMARTFAVGDIAEENIELLAVTHKALNQGIEATKAGNKIGDISHAVETWIVSHGFSVVKDYVGHGIGTRLHEDPPIPNYGLPKSGPELKTGMVIAIEPMVNIGTEKVKVLKDGWTVVTKDGRPSAHFENTVAVTENGPEILTRVN